MSDQIPFRGFDERGEVRIYQHGLLPHWRQIGCTYFVTFRQADSLPAAIVLELKDNQGRWLIHHGIDPESKQWKSHFLTLPPVKRREFEKLIAVELDKHLDAGHGSCVLRKPEMGNLVADALPHFHKRRWLTGDLVIMPNHVHALVRPLPGFELEDVLHSVKSFTANRINRSLGETGAFWQRQSYDRIVRDFDQLEAYQQYIAANPEKAGLSSGEFVLKRANWVPEG